MTLERKNNLMVLKFAEQMLKELENNANKGDITQWTGIREKLFDLDEHKAKLMIELKEHRDANRIRELIADCANILMAIGNEFGFYETPYSRLKPSGQ